MKKKNSSTGLWISVIILISIVVGYNLKDQGFFQPRPPAQNEVAPKPQESDLAGKKAGMKSMAPTPASGPESRGPGGPPAIKPQKPKPSETSTGSQWYAEEAR